MRTSLAALALLAVAASAQAPGSSARYRHADEIDWKVSGSLPGAEYHLVYEDPVTHGVQTLVRFPSGYSLPSHFHSKDETLFIVKGKLLVEYGGPAQTLGPGSYAVIPAGLLHSLTAKSALTMLMSVNGPYDVKGLSPAKP